MIHVWRLVPFFILILFSCRAPVEPVRTPEIRPLQEDVKQRVIHGGEAHTYQFWLNEGDYLGLTLRQWDVDLKLELQGPDTYRLVDGFTGASCREVLRFCARNEGRYCLRIAPLKVVRVDMT